MRRREFITVLGGAAVWPLAARAQQPAMPVIGFLAGASASASKATVGGFRQGLRQTGYVEGQNAHIAFRWADGRFDRFSELAAELASLPVAVIAAFGAPAAMAAISVTKTIPVVFTSSADPVKLGLVASLNRPGGNATGVAFLTAELVGKHFELLREMLPKAATMGLLVNPASANAEVQLASVPVAAKALGLQVVVQSASRDRDLETAFVTFVQQRIDALVVASDAFFYGQREQLITLAARHALPVMYYDREYVADGGLISYGTSITDAYRQAGVFAGRILKGDKPADLPVQQAIQTELVINLQTAKALGIDMPLSLLLRVNRDDRMKRREFILLAGSAAAAWPLNARAQQGERVRRIGVLESLNANDKEGQARISAFTQGLQQLGWTDGRNVQIDIRFGPADATIRKHAAEMVALAPEVILASGSAVAGPLLQLTHTVPIVFVIVPDPVDAGFVASLARPGGNATGFLSFEYSISAKLLELLKEVMPSIMRAAVIRDPAISAGLGQFAAIQAVAPSLGVDVTPVNVRDPNEIERDITAFARAPKGGLIVTGSALAATHRHLIAKLAAQHKLPAVYIQRLFVEAGGLLSYGPNFSRSIPPGGRLRRSHPQGREAG